MKTNASSRLIYSPVEQIPLGEPVVTEDGRLALKIKHKTKGNHHKEEIVPLDYYYSQTVNAAADRNPRVL